MPCRICEPALQHKRDLAAVMRVRRHHLSRLDPEQRRFAMLVIADPALADSRQHCLPLHGGKITTNERRNRRRQYIVRGRGTAHSCVRGCRKNTLQHFVPPPQRNRRNRVDFMRSERLKGPDKSPIIRLECQMRRDKRMQGRTKRARSVPCQKTVQSLNLVRMTNMNCHEPKSPKLSRS